MSLRFVPPPKVARYATYTDAYGMRLFNDLGSAKYSARNQMGSYSWTGDNDNARADGFILELVDGEWYKLYEIKKGERLPWMKEVEVWGSNFISDRRKEMRAVPMTREEYANWRLAIERERILTAAHNQLTFYGQPVTITTTNGAK